MAQELYDALIVGGGAAGLSAALLLGRSLRSAIVCDDGRPRNIVAREMHGFLTREGMPPGEMLETARKQLERYPQIELAQMHVVEARAEPGGFLVTGEAGQRYRAKRILLATGLYDALPEIAHVFQYWGKGVFVCPYCDGWELRGKRLAAIGKGRRAVELAQELYQWSRDLIVCLQATSDLTEDHRRWLDAAGVPAYEGKVESVNGSTEAIEAVTFADGRREPCDAVFLSAPLRQRYPLVEMLGCRVRADGEIEADECGRTNVPGVYAAGDAVTKYHQVALAVGSGVRAAIAMNEDQLEEDVREAIDRGSTTIAAPSA